MQSDLKTGTCQVLSEQLTHYIYMYIYIYIYIYIYVCVCVCMYVCVCEIKVQSSPVLLPSLYTYEFIY